MRPIIFAAQELIMRKLLLAPFVLLASISVIAQTPATTKTKKTYDLVSRAGDHFMFQVAHNNWNGAPDSISSRINSFNRSANAYLMLDKPFKSDRRFSVGLGVGVGTSNIYFKKTTVDIGGTSKDLRFINTDTSSHYKKYKLSTAYAEVPLELRFTANPSNPNKSLKAAIGVKIGTLVNAHTKGKTLQNAAGSTINSQILKINSKTYFNTTRIAATARVGYGVFSLFGAYNLTTMFKDGVAADVKLLQVGITISGL